MANEEEIRNAIKCVQRAKRHLTTKYSRNALRSLNEQERHLMRQLREPVNRGTCDTSRIMPPAMQSTEARERRLRLIRWRVRRRLEREREEGTDNGQQADPQARTALLEDASTSVVLPPLLIRDEHDRVLPFRNNVTEVEVWASLLAVHNKHRVSKHLLVDLCQLVNSFLHENTPFELPRDFRKLDRALASFMPMKATWIVFCKECGKITAEFVQDEQPSHAECDFCERSLDADLEDGVGVFQKISLKEQVMSFLRRGSLTKAIEAFRKIKDIPRGPYFESAIHSQGIPVSIGSDAAPLTKWPKKSFYGVMLFFQELPPEQQAMFPVLVAAYCGRTNKKPPTDVLYSVLQKEIDEFNAEGIKWRDDEESSTIEIILVHADCPERRSILNQQTQGKHSCTLCLQPGSFKDGNTRLADLVHESNWPLRTEMVRLEAAEKAKEALREGKFETVDGVFDFPILYNRPHYEASFCVPPDLLHVVYLGLCTDIMGCLCGGTGAEEHLKRRAEYNFDSESHIKFTIL